MKNCRQTQEKCLMEAVWSTPGQAHITGQQFLRFNLLVDKASLKTYILGL